MQHLIYLRGIWIIDSEGNGGIIITDLKSEKFSSTYVS